MIKNIIKIAILHAAACFSPTLAFSQACSLVQVAHEFSYEDTLNSSGAPLTSAYTVFQQDRFYVNKRGRLDPNDKPDPVMINPKARTNYGLAIKAYMEGKGIEDTPAQDLVGSQYTVELEACGSQDNPVIQILSMNLGGDTEDDSFELELEYREADLAEWEQRLSKKETDLKQWEIQLSDWEKRLSDWDFRLSELQAKVDSEASGSGDRLNEQTPAPKKSPSKALAIQSNTLKPYSSKSFDYTPCSDWPIFEDPQEIQNFHVTLVQLIDMYNRQPDVDMKMRYPNPDLCTVSVGRTGTLLAGVTSAEMWVSKDHFNCAVLTENCQGDLVGYDASMIFYPGNRRQLNINTYRFEDALFFCYGPKGLESGRCEM